MKKKTGKVLIRAGLIMILLAFGLTCFNIWDSHRADKLSENILSQIQISEITDGSQLNEAFFGDIQMPEIVIDGVAYIGVIELPALGKILPVAGECTEKLLRVSPCRYEGSVYSGNMIVAGHNYRSHLGGIRQLQPGDPVCFTDADGNVFSYEVLGIEKLHGTDIEGMTSGEWDLTLFTCTPGGSSRLAVRMIQGD